MSKASFAASVGAPLVTLGAEEQAAPNRSGRPKSGPGLAPRCALRLERAGCPARACQKALEPREFGAGHGPSAANVHMSDSA